MVLGARQMIHYLMFGIPGKLCALDCILLLPSNLYHQFARYKNTTAVLLDIKKAYDDVSSLWVLRRFEELGIAGRAQDFTRNDLYNRSIRVSLGRSLSDSRILAKRLLRGYASSTIIISVVLSGILPFPANSPPEVRLPVFAVGICLSTPALIHKHLCRACRQLWTMPPLVQSLLESCFHVVFTGNGQLARKDPRLICQRSIRQVFKESLLGLHLGSRR